MIKRKTRINELQNFNEIYKNLFFNIESQKEFTQLSKNIRNYKINLISKANK